MPHVPPCSSTPSYVLSIAPFKPIMLHCQREHTFRRWQPLGKERNMSAGDSNIHTTHRTSYFLKRNVIPLEWTAAILECNIATLKWKNSIFDWTIPMDGGVCVLGVKNLVTASWETSKMHAWKNADLEETRILLSPKDRRSVERGAYFGGGGCTSRHQAPKGSTTTACILP